jgi:putative N6-adenine-specific DNA methylase
MARGTLGVMATAPRDRDSNPPRPRPPRHDAFVVCAPGLEPLVRDELVALGLKPGASAHGGVSVKLTTRQLYLVNAWLRTASRVLVRIGRFKAVTFAQLEARLDELPWGDFIGPDVTVTANVSSRSSALYHSDAIAERVVRSAGRGSARQGRPGSPEQLVVVRMSDDNATVSVDTSGDRLHRRGWRLATAKAPLRETLAAAAVIASGWDRHQPLLDPFCGSGTIAIEAALLALGAAPGAGRPFGFELWPTFEPGTWASVGAGLIPDAPADLPRIIASDRDAGAIEATRENAERAGVEDMIETHVMSFSDAMAHVAATSTTPGWIVTNPPYGERVGAGGDRRDLFAKFGAPLRAGGAFAQWGAAFLTPDQRLASHIGVPLHRRFSTTNGGIDIALVATR